MSQLPFSVRRADRSDAKWLDAASAASRLRPPAYFEELCWQQDAGLLALLIAECGPELYAGHLRIHWEAAYKPFRAATIAELQDLYVPPHYRRRGVATRLLNGAEALIARRAAAGQCAAQVGIAVALHAAYGPAQRLYVRRGYVPDGRGAHYRRQPIHDGQRLTFDDEAVLYLIKDLPGS